MNALTEPLPSSPSTRPYSQWFEVHASLGIAFIDHLFNRLDGAYPNKWRANFANQQAIDNWAESWVEAFEEEGITAADVKAGLRECRKRFAWPPSCAEFIQACKPSLDPLKAYHEAVAGLEARGKGELGVWSHPAVYWAASLLKSDLMGQTYAQVKSKWEQVLKGQMERTEWAEIPPARLALPAPDTSPAAKEHAAKMVRELGASGAIKKSSDGINHLRWAQNIITRLLNKDKSLSMIQIQFAKTALGIVDEAPE